jgi:2-keto-4-pentenoate hydratase/2-oxohepta-3-ene-1,7-dioic acid hydratase in catechol pathway
MLLQLHRTMWSSWGTGRSSPRCPQAADDAILLPPQSERGTAEAELGIVIGRTAWQVDEADALDHIAAVFCILDQTAEDILQRNPRFLTRSKNFETFLSLGGELVTTDEVRSPETGLGHLTVGTWRNGVLHRENTVDDMVFDPAALVAFHSHVFHCSQVTSSRREHPAQSW